MSTIDLINKTRKSSKTISPTQRKTRLIKAHIIKENGEYDPKYFSAKTVQTSKKIVASIKA